MIYLIEDDSYYKIGYTINIYNRLNNYKTHNLNARLVSIKDGNLEDEKLLHIKLSKYLVSNEWYLKDRAVLDELNNYDSNELRRKFITNKICDEYVMYNEAFTKANSIYKEFIISIIPYVSETYEGKIGNNFTLNDYVESEIASKLGIRPIDVRGVVSQLKFSKILIKDKLIDNNYWISPKYLYVGNIKYLENLKLFLFEFYGKY